MNIVGTPCSAVQRSSATALNAATRIERLAGKHHRARRWTRTPAPPAPCRSSGTAAPGCTANPGSEKSIAIAMKRPLLTTLRCVSVAPFGLPVVPLVNWMLIASVAEAIGERHGFVRPTPFEDVGVVEHAGRALVAHADDRTSSAGAARGRTFCSISRYIEVLKALGRDDRAAARHLQGIGELGQPVGRVDVDQHQPLARGGELGDQPFHAVGRPDAHAVALGQAQPGQAGAEGIDLGQELAPGPAHALFAEHHRGTVGVAIGRVGEQAVDGRVGQRNVGPSRDVRQAVDGKRRGDVVRCCIHRGLHLVARHRRARGPDAFATRINQLRERVLPQDVRSVSA